MRRPLNNKAFVIILAAALAVSSIAAFGIQTAKADYSDIKILSYSTYISPGPSATSYSGDLIVVGEVQNQGNSVFELAQITAVAYTKDGQPVANVFNSAYVKDLLPGQKAPFYMDFNVYSTDPNGNFSGTVAWIPDFDHVQLSVWAQETNDTMYRGVQVLGSTSYNVNNVYSVTGYVQNTGTELTGNTWVVTTFYNSTGGVVAANYTGFLTHSFAPNASLSFTATPMDNSPALSSQIANYSVIVQTMPYDPAANATPTPTPNANETPTPNTTATPPPTTGPQTTNTDDTVLYAVIGAVIIVVAIVAMILIRKRRG